MLITRCRCQVSGLVLHNSVSWPQTTTQRPPGPYLELWVMKWDLGNHSDTNPSAMTDRSWSDFNDFTLSTLHSCSTLGLPLQRGDSSSPGPVTPGVRVSLLPSPVTAHPQSDPRLTCTSSPPWEARKIWRMSEKAVPPHPEGNEWQAKTAPGSLRPWPRVTAQCPLQLLDVEN